MKTFIPIFFLLFPLMVFAHGKEDHSKSKSQKKENQNTVDQTHSEMNQDDQMNQMMKEHFAWINQHYATEAKSILIKKCADCHGTPDSYPWYYAIPGIKQIMDYDIREAKKHIELSNDFPFGGHGNPESDLKGLRKTVSEGNMPPFRYWIANPSSRLTDADKKAILSWIDLSLKRLKPYFKENTNTKAETH
ncbi:heme-binding domain-containing protein [bacterium]|nr:heme-binding domain-containing protein [bacterium]